MQQTRQQVVVLVEAALLPIGLPSAGKDLLVDLYTDLVLAHGVRLSRQDVHEAWCRWAKIYHPDDDSVVPFDKLDEADKNKDLPYVRELIKIARVLQK